MIISVNNKEFNINELYQPLYKNEIDIKPQRICTDRWRSILQAEEGFNFNNLFNNEIADWGCSLGFFSFCLSEKTNLKIHAIDSDDKNIEVCKEIQKQNNIENIDFICGTVPEQVPEDLKGHFIFSIVHHFQNSIDIPENVFNKIKNSEIIYLELAHCNEWPFWSGNLIIDKGYFLSPFHALHKILEKQFPDFVVRLIGVHNTHIGSVRPLFQLKRKIKEQIKTDVFTGIIYDRFKLPYIDFGDFSLREDGFLAHGCRSKKNISYAYAEKENGEKVHLKFEENKIICVSDYIQGYLLIDIIKFRMLPYYDRYKIKLQLSEYNFSNHKDPQPWNFFVTEDSEIIPIDYDSEKSSFLNEEDINIYLQSIIQLI